jgi:hypothetical protein
VVLRPGERFIGAMPVHGVLSSWLTIATHNGFHGRGPCRHFGA